MKLSSALLLNGLLLTPLFAKTYTVDEAIKIALLNNQRKNISVQDQAIAEAKYKQALSANYPTLDVTLVANRKDQSFIDKTDYNFDASALGSILGSAFGSALGPAVGAALGSALNSGSLAIPIKYTHTVMGRDTQTAKIEAQYALYTGGKITALQKQAKAGIEYAKEASKLTDDKIAYNVKKYYAATILSQKIQKLMQDTVDRMQATYELTETFYKGKSMKVKKTDYLRAKMMLLSMKSILISLKNATKLAKSALSFEMGLGDSSKVDIKANSYKAYKLEGSLKDYYQKLYTYNHMIKQTNIGLEAMDAKIDEAKSGYFPMVALYANAQSLHNNKDGGIINSQNNDSWNIGVAITYNIFSGGLTTAQEQTARAEKLRLKSQQAFLKSGLKLKAKKAFLNAKTAQNQMKIMQEATKTAKENSDLNFRAYQEEMVETKDVLESQFMSSLTEASFYKTQYASLINEAELEYLVGVSLK